jgi:hypothetical protein
VHVRKTLPKENSQLFFAAISTVADSNIKGIHDAYSSESRIKKGDKQEKV